MLREERIITQMGTGGSQQLLAIHPLHLQGEFDVQINVMDESTVKQEKVSEKMALVNMAAQLVPLGVPVNMKQFVTDVLEAQGVQDTDSYFQAQPAQLPGAPPGPPGPPGPAGAPAPIDPQSLMDQMQTGPSPPGQTNIPLAAGMGGGQLGPGQGLRTSPQQFAQQQIQAAQQLGMG